MVHIWWSLEHTCFNASPWGGLPFKTTRCFLKLKKPVTIFKILSDIPFCFNLNIRPLCQKLGSRDYWQIVDCILNKGKSAIPLLFNDPDVLSAASDKAKLFAENCSKNSNLEDAGIFLSAFPSRTNLKLRNTFVTPTLCEKCPNMELFLIHISLYLD